MTPEKCTELLNQIPAMERPALQHLWAELFGQPPHPKLRRQLMVPILAYRVQEKTYGGLKASTRNYLRKLAKAIEDGRRTEPPTRIKPGTKLLREWHDEMHEVVVTANGLHYRGNSYKTLSEIATQITGTKWSGPLFFGLRKRKEVAAK